MKRINMLFALAVCGIMMVGCGAAESEGTEPAETETSSSSEGEMQLTEFRINGKLVCPIMDAPIEDESAIEGWVEHEGVKYAMCCAVCMKKGEEDPAMVAEKAAAL